MAEKEIDKRLKQMKEYEEKLKLLEKSKNLAYKLLPSGEILNETNETSVIGDTMFACTTITVLGVIND